MNMSDPEMAAKARALLDGQEDAEGPVTDPSEPPVESDHQEDGDTEEISVEEVEKLPEDHNPDATLEEEPQEKKQPQFRVDAKNLAEKWDTMSEGEQIEKLERLKKSGRTSTLNALAEELGTTPDKLSKAYDPKEDEIAALKEKLQELESVIPVAQKQAELDRYITEVQKWAEHNKFTPEETKAVVGLDSEVRKAFESAKYDPETGEKLSFKGRLKLALNKSETVRETIAAKKAGERFAGLQEGLRAKIPGKGTTAPEKSWEGLSGLALLEAQDKATGMRKW